MNAVLAELVKRPGADLSPPDGAHAVEQALLHLQRGQDFSGPVRAALVRSFGRHPIVKALLAIQERRAQLVAINERLFVCAPSEQSLARARAVLAPAMARAQTVFGQASPLVLVQVPSTYGPRLAASPAIGLAYVQFPLYPAEGKREAMESACHEFAHTYCWSGRRFLDEAVADWFAGNVPASQPMKNAGPSTRALIEADNGQDLHFETLLQKPGDFQQLRGRGVALAQRLVEQIGSQQLPGLYEEILGLTSAGASSKVEQVIGMSLEQWDAAQSDEWIDPVQAAKTLLSKLEQGDQALQEEQLAELDAWLRDARRQGLPQGQLFGLQARRTALHAHRCGTTPVQTIQAQTSLHMMQVRHAAMQPRGDAQTTVAGGLPLTIQDLRVKGHAGFELHIPRLTVQAGERIGLVGPNGSGKSTLLAVLSEGLSTSVSINGQSLPQWLAEPSRRAQVGVALNEFPYYPSLRVHEVISLHRTLYGAPDADIARSFDLSAHLNTPLKELSCGWKQVVSLYMAFAHNPQLVLLDEPSLGLDGKHAQELRKLLDPKTNTRRQTILLSSHVAADLQPLQRLVALRQGRLAADAGIEQMLLAFGSCKAFVAEKAAEKCKHELRALPGFRGARGREGRLFLNGDQHFAAAFRCFAQRYEWDCFGIEPTDIHDLLDYLTGDQYD